MIQNRTSLKNSIATKLLQVIFGLYFIVTLIVTLVQIGLEYNYQEKQIQQEIHELPPTFDPILANALWTLNYPQIQSTLSGLLKVPAVTGVRIEDEQGTTIRMIGNVIDAQGKAIFVDEQGISSPLEGEKGFFSQPISFNFPIVYEDKNNETRTIGKWVVYSSQKIVIDRVKHGFFLIVINSIIKTLALWIIFIVAARIILGRPLALLTSTVEQIDMNNLKETRLNLPTGQNNEFKILENAFNKMLNKLNADAEEIKTLSMNLEEKVQQRTAELQEAQTHLIHSEKMASMGTLVAGIAHEINNPTNFVHNGAQNLERRLGQLQEFIFQLAEEGNQEEIQKIFQPKLEPIFQNLTAIIDGSERIRKIVTDLRTFSRIDENNRLKTDIIESLKSTLGLVRSNYQESVEFICQFDASPIIECWPSQLSQVFMNMMVNACQAIVFKQKQNPKRIPGTLTIRTFLKDNELGICFRDTGCGIPLEIQNKIFDPFFTTKTVGEGTGLGLSISFGIIKRHQGRITLESQAGEGSTFTIFLPLQPIYS